MLADRIKVVADIPGVQMRPAELNGSPGTLLLDGQGRLIAVWALEIGRDQILGIRSIVNPDKLAHLGPTADLTSLLQSTSAEEQQHVSTAGSVRSSRTTRDGRRRLPPEEEADDDLDRAHDQQERAVDRGDDADGHVGPDEERHARCEPERPAQQR